MPSAPNQKLDWAEATKLLAEGMTIREVSVLFGCSTQAIYEAIERGRILRPAAA